jgi:anti-sigma regulatory factor (Ser/Thr protein kinase)
MQGTGKLRVKAVLENVSAAMDFVTQAARAVGCEEQALNQILLGVDEVCANVVDHAYKGMEQGDMEVSWCLEGQDFVVSVRDWGRSFDPNSIEDPDVDAPLEERSLGGLGLFLVRQVMDRAEYSSDPGRGNQWTLVKRLELGRQRF